MYGYYCRFDILNFEMENFDISVEYFSQYEAADKMLGKYLGAKCRCTA